MSGQVSLNPLVSVIIPNYNHSRYLKARIDSVLRQTYSNFEVIILDDASTDDSISIIESYRGHEKISHIIYNQENSGNTFAQWQKGLVHAQGEWIWWAESDDVAELDFLSTCIDQSNQAGLVFTASRIVDENGATSTFLAHEKWPNTSSFHTYKNISQLQSSSDFLVKELYRFNHIVNASAVIVKKSILPELTNWRSDFVLCGDWFLWVKILSNTDFVYIDIPLNLFRIHAQTQRERYEKDMRIFFENARIVHYIHSCYPKTVDKQDMSDYLIYSYFNRYNRTQRKGTFYRFLCSLWPLGLRFCLQGIKNKWKYD